MTATSQGPCENEMSENTWNLAWHMVRVQQALHNYSYVLSSLLKTQEFLMPLGAGMQLGIRKAMEARTSHATGLSRSPFPSKHIWFILCLSAEPPSLTPRPRHQTCPPAALNVCALGSAMFLGGFSCELEDGPQSRGK